MISSVYNSKSKSAIYFVLVFFQLILIYESPAMETKWSKEFITITPFVVAFSILFVALFLKKPFILNIKSLLTLLFLIFIKLLNSLIYMDFSKDNTVFILIVLTGWMIASICNKRKYLCAYSDAICILSAYSLIATYILQPLCQRGMISLFDTIVNELGRPFIDMKFAYVLGWDGIMRNQGFTREPGVFAFFLLVALFYELNRFPTDENAENKNKKTSIVKPVILIITLLTTASTAAYVALIIYLVGVLISNKTARRQKRFIGICSLLLLMLVLFFDSLSSFLFADSITKLSTSGARTTVVRLESIINNLKAMFRTPLSPLIGNSIVNGLHYIQNNLATYTKTVDVTGTNLIFCMGLGIPAGLIITAMFFKFCKLLTSDKLMELFCFIALFACLNAQALLYDTVIWTFWFMANENPNDYELRISDKCDIA